MENVVRCTSVSDSPPFDFFFFVVVVCAETDPKKIASLEKKLGSVREKVSTVVHVALGFDGYRWWTAFVCSV